MKHLPAGFHEGRLSIEMDGDWQPVLVVGGAFTGKLSSGLARAGAWQISPAG